MKTSDTFKTEDGFILYRTLTCIPNSNMIWIWTDRDLEFDSDTEGFPVDDLGERLPGEFI